MKVEHLQPATLFDSQPFEFAQVVTVEGARRTIYCAGQTAIAKDLAVIGPGDYAQQAEEAYRNVALALAAAGATPADVVFLRNYVVGYNPGHIELINNSDKDKEVSVSMVFGYPAYDSLGKTFMKYNDSIGELKHSLVPNITFFPKKMVLKSKESQTIKFMVKNSSKLPDATYWTRIITKSKDLESQIDTQTVNGVKVGMNLEFAMVTALIFEKVRIWKLNHATHTASTRQTCYRSICCVNLAPGNGFNSCWMRAPWQSV